MFFNRRLKSLVVIDLKIGVLTHADAGQMHFYLNYAKEHWVKEGENPPVGLILCSEKDEALARYALQGLPNTVMASEYRITPAGRGPPRGGARTDAAGNRASCFPVVSTSHSQRHAVSERTGGKEGDCARRGGDGLCRQHTGSDSANGECSTYRRC